LGNDGYTAVARRAGARGGHSSAQPRVVVRPLFIDGSSSDGAPQQARTDGAHRDREPPAISP